MYFHFYFSGSSIVQLLIGGKGKREITTPTQGVTKASKKRKVVRSVSGQSKKTRSFTIQAEARSKPIQEAFEVAPKETGPRLDSNVPIKDTPQVVPVQVEVQTR